MTVPEAPLVRTEDGLVPDGEGWFVLNAAEARWVGAVGLGRAVPFESREHRFAEFGINIHRIEPGEPNCMYHSENAQEAFLVLSGECLLIVEGQERALKAWDFAHFPAGTRHVVIGAGEEPALVLMVGTRKEPEEVEYPADAAAQRHGAGVDEPTTEPERAYAGRESFVGPYEPGHLPGA